MRWMSLVLVCTALLVSLLPAGAVAQEDTVHLTIEAHDGASECPGERTYCYRIVEGNLTDLSPGAVVNVTFANRGSVTHELVFANLSAADTDGRDTDEDAGFFEIEEIPSGGEENATVTLPEDIEGIYLWCDIPLHENLGMYRAHSFNLTDDGDDGPAGDGDEDGEDVQSQPGPGVLLVVLAGLGAAAVRVRGSRR